MSTNIIQPADVEKVAKLANLPINTDETAKFASQFSATLNIVDELSEVNTDSVIPTYQVNNLENITREDIVDSSRILPQTIAIREASKTHKGYIVVPRIIDNS